MRCLQDTLDSFRVKPAPQSTHEMRIDVEQPAQDLVVEPGRSVLRR